MIRISSRTFLAHLESTGLARVLDIAYHAAIADPAATASRLADFLGPLAGNVAFNAPAAATAVDAGLRRISQP